jgi:hypothetical protein
VGRHHHSGAADSVALNAPMTGEKQRFFCGKTPKSICYTLRLCYVCARFETRFTRRNNQIQE